MNETDFPGCKDGRPVEWRGRGPSSRRRGLWSVVIVGQQGALFSDWGDEGIKAIVVSLPVMTLCSCGCVSRLYTVINHREKSMTWIFIYCI